MVRGGELMDHNNERNNVGGSEEKNGNAQAGSNATQGISGEAAGTFTDAVSGAMIGAPFGLFGAVIGSVSGGLIGNQVVETDDEETRTASNNLDINNDKDSD
jgi:phage tail tape-measure protein